MILSQSPATFRSLRRAVLASFALFLPAAASARTIASFAPATAAAGSTVIITGLNLAAVKPVVLSGQTMRITGIPMATSVAVIVPPASAMGRPRLTTSTGTVLSGAKLAITRQSSAVSYGNISTAATSANAGGNFSTPTAGDINNNGNRPADGPGQRHHHAV